MKATVSDETVDGLIFSLTDERNPDRATASREKLNIWLDDQTLELTEQQRSKIENALAEI